MMTIAIVDDEASASRANGFRVATLMQVHGARGSRVSWTVYESTSRETHGGHFRLPRVVYRSPYFEDRPNPLI